jgi:hypothetical protein
VVDKVQVSWTAPYDNGSPITGYKVYIRENDSLVYTQESSYCVENDLGTSCQILLTLLAAEPWNLGLNVDIWAKVIAVNQYGDSPLSAGGNGAINKLVPDAPVALTNDFASTDNQKIRFTWSDGASDGGVTIIDYEILYN